MTIEKILLLGLSVIVVAAIVSFGLRTEEIDGRRIFQPIVAVPVFLALLAASLAYLKSVFDRIVEVAEAEAELLLLELLQEAPGIELRKIRTLMKRKSRVFYIVPTSVTIALRSLVRSGRVETVSGKYYLVQET